MDETNDDEFFSARIVDIAPETKKVKIQENLRGVEANAGEMDGVAQTLEESKISLTKYAALDSEVKDHLLKLLDAMSAFKELSSTQKDKACASFSLSEQQVEKLLKIDPELGYERTDLKSKVIAFNAMTQIEKKDWCEPTEEEL